MKYALLLIILFTSINCEPRDIDNDKIPIEQVNKTNQAENKVQEFRDKIKENQIEEEKRLEKILEN